MELPINVVVMLVVLLAIVAVLLVLLSRGGSNFTDPVGDKIGSAERFTRSGILYTALDLTFKDVVKNIIKQPNQCMTYQNINPPATDLPTFP